jgi:hypothetical protein
MEVRQVTQNDFDSVHSLLKRLNDTSLNKSSWAKLLTVDFGAKEMPYGFVLENEGKILGFIGTIYSVRRFNTKEYNFCNIHSWIVDPSAKSKGMNLLLKVLSQKEQIITNFTASEGPYKIFKALKFKELDFENRKLFPFQKFGGKSDIKIGLIDRQNSKELLNKDELQIYQSHCEFDNVQFLLIRLESKRSFLVTKKKPYIPNLINRIPYINKIMANRLQLAEIFYASNSRLFSRAVLNSKTCISICKKLGCVGLIAKDLILDSNLDIRSKVYPQKRPYLYRHSNDEELIDALYSELFVLNL